MSIQKLHYENISGMLIRREGLLNWRCPLCKAEGQSCEVIPVCPKCGSKEATFSCAQPAPSLASDDVSLISEVKTQPTQNVKDDIISDLQSQFDTEGITEYASGDALIRLSDAIAAVEDNFALAQPSPSIPDGWKLVTIEPTEEMYNAGANHCDGYWSTAQAVWDAMLAAAPEDKP